MSGSFRSSPRYLNRPKRSRGSTVELRLSNSPLERRRRTVHDEIADNAILVDSGIVRRDGARVPPVPVEAFRDTGCGGAERVKERRSCFKHQRGDGRLRLRDFNLRSYVGGLSQIGLGSVLKTSLQSLSRLQHDGAGCVGETMNLADDLQHLRVGARTRRGSVRVVSTSFGDCARRVAGRSARDSDEGRMMNLLNIGRRVAEALLA